MSHPVLELQAAETMSDQLKNRRDRLAERELVQAARNDLIRWDQSRKLLHQRLDELERQIEASEKESHDIDRKRTKLEAQLKTIVAPREAEALQSEIRTLNARRGELDDAELEALEEQSRLEDELSAVLGQERELTEALTTSDTALVAAERDIDGELNGIAGRLVGSPRRRRQGGAEAVRPIAIAVRRGFHETQRIALRRLPPRPVGT